MTWGAAGEQQVPRAPLARFGMTMALGRNDNRVRAEGQRRKRARADEMEAQRGARPTCPKLYRRPEARNRETGSATGCRLNTQRATAKPRAA